MAKKPTLTSLRLMVGELLASKAVVDRYKSLEKSIKAGLVDLGKREIVVKQGRVFISESTLTTIDPDVARAELGPELAKKVIVTKETVSNKILDAFVKAGDINPEQHEALLAKAETKPKVSLHVRPLK